MLVRVEGQRWAIEDSFETAKNELGLDHNETRSWHGWHRHVSLVMLAFAMMVTIRHKANAAPPPKTTRPTRRRSEEHTSELQSLMRISYAVFCLKKKKQTYHTHNKNPHLLRN